MSIVYSIFSFVSLCLSMKPFMVRNLDYVYTFFFKLYMKIIFTNKIRLTPFRHQIFLKHLCCSLTTNYRINDHLVKYYITRQCRKWKEVKTRTEREKHLYITLFHQLLVAANISMMWYMIWYDMIWYDMICYRFRCENICNLIG